MRNPHYGNQGGTPGASVRDGDWKLIRFFEDGRGAQYEELYNLEEDIGETKNVLAENAEVAEKLGKMLTDWQEEIKALIPEPNPDFVSYEGREPAGHFEE